VLAGADIVLLSSWEGSVPAIISSLKIALNDGRLSMARIDESVVRIIEAKLRYGVISFGEDKIVRAGSFSISEAEKNLLQKGVRVNREISRKAVSHTGTMPESAKLPNVRKIIISRDRNFGMTGVRATVFPDFASFYGKMSIKLGSPVVVFYHVNERNIDSIKNISKECARRKLDLVLVSTGNPFPIAMSNPPVPVLYSYSDTPESIRQLRLCIEAAFLPKTAINLKLSGK
jgi:beta-N-acetylhexosaminidase